MTAVSELKSTSAAVPSARSSGLGMSGIRRIFERASSIPDVIRLEIGEPDFQTPENIKLAAQKAIASGRTKYTSGAGMPELRGAIAEKLKREHGLDYDPRSDIVVTAGATSALNLSLLAALDPGDEILVPNPGWATYVYAIQIVGGLPIEYKLDARNDYRIDVEAIGRLISKKTRAVLINTPSNPMGSIFDDKDMKAISEIALQHNLTVISDEVYERFVYDRAKPYPSIATLPQMRERTIVLNSFSKTYAMTGWRVGYVASGKPFGEAMAKVNTAANSCVSQISQIAAVEALTGPQESVANMIKVYTERRELIVRKLNSMQLFECPYPRGAFFAFPSIKKHLGESRSPSFDLSMQILEKARVATVPGSAFGSEGEGHLRFSYANSTENIEEAMNRISTAFPSL